jgi:hypothetical protein
MRYLTRSEDRIAGFQPETLGPDDGAVFAKPIFASGNASDRYLRCWFAGLCDQLTEWQPLMRQGMRVVPCFACCVALTKCLTLWRLKEPSSSTRPPKLIAKMPIPQESQKTK